MKKVILLVLVFALVTSLIACSANTESNSVESDAEEIEQAQALEAEAAKAEEEKAAAEAAAAKAAEEKADAEAAAAQAAADIVAAEKALLEAKTEAEKITAEQALAEAEAVKVAEEKAAADKTAADKAATERAEAAKMAAAKAAEDAARKAAAVAATKALAEAAKSTEKPKKSKIVMVWLPNESGGDFSTVRDVFANLITQATGIPVEHKLTTDYLIAVEAIANNNADLAFLGAQAYVEANAKNKKVQSLFVNTGPSGTLRDAVYYAWLAVNKADESAYQSNGKYSIDNIAGKKFSWVSTSSTSGFKVPAAGIVNYFSKMDKYKTLKADDLLEGGSNKFFSEVLFGVSHQGSAVNLLSGKTQVSSFCDACVDSYIQLSSGTANRPGASYKVRSDATEPFNTVIGKEFTLIQVTPVLNAPFVANTDTLSLDLIDKILAKFTSEEVTKNPAVFAPAGYASKTFFRKTKDERFVPAIDSWFQPIRDLSK